MKFHKRIVGGLCAMIAVAHGPCELRAARFEFPVTLNFGDVSPNPDEGFTIQASALPSEAFFGKNVLIPVEVSSSKPTIDSKNLQVSIAYQLFDTGDQSLTLPTSIPIKFLPHPTKRNTLSGSALIPLGDLQPIRRGGKLKYILIAKQGSRGTMLNSRGLSAASSSSQLIDPFQTSIIPEWCGPVTAAGSRVSAPDLSLVDGRTSVFFAPGTLSGPGTLCISSEDPVDWPAGPGGTKPAAVYSITLNQTALQQPAQLILSYPADIDGKVTGLSVNGDQLAIHWLETSARALGSRQWLPLGRATVDTTLHTVSAMTAHFSTFALFPTGAVSSVGLRTSKRILTPNGDGINETATFGTEVEEVHLFDMRGRRVRTLRGPAPVWDGRDDEGDRVESGVYLYQYTSQGDTISGVIAVVK